MCQMQPHNNFGGQLSTPGGHKGPPTVQMKSSKSSISSFDHVYFHSNHHPNTSTTVLQSNPTTQGNSLHNPKQFQTSSFHHQTIHPKPKPFKEAPTSLIPQSSSHTDKNRSASHGVSSPTSYQNSQNS